MPNIDPVTYARLLHDHTLDEFAKREADLVRLLTGAPQTPADVKLLTACVGFALAELQKHKASKLLPKHEN